MHLSRSWGALQMVLSWKERGKTDFLRERTRVRALCWIARHSQLDRADDQFGGDCQAQAVRVEYEVVVVRVGRVGPVHGPFEVLAAAIQVERGPARGPD